MHSIIIVTEANENVATGHLMECIVCAEELGKKDFFISFWINKDAKEDLKERIPCTYQEYEKTIEKDYESLYKQIGIVHPNAIVFNLRKISKNFLNKIRNISPNSSKLICIDELGHRELPADVIINPMIDSYYWNYGDSKARLFCGHKYLILPPELAELHLRNKVINKEIKNIVITMGGVDPKNHTFHLIDIISHNYSDATIYIIIGGGNLHQKEITEQSKKYSNIKIYKNVSNLPQKMFQADLMICAGGNTLHETACVGTPAMIIPSMPHEKITAKYFEKNGFGYVIDVDKNFYNKIVNICVRLTEVQERKRMSENGKKISDGLGWKRVIGIIEDMVCFNEK